MTNAQRGFWRLWIAISVLWVVFVFALGSLLLAEGPFWRILPTIADGWAAREERAASYGPWEDYQPTFELETPDGTFEFKAPNEQAARERALIEARIIRGRVVAEGAVSLGWIATIPPAALLGMGLVAGWVVRGFRKG